MHAAGNADPTGFGKLLQPRRYIYASAVDVVALDNDVADVDTHAKVDPLIGSQAGIAAKHSALHVNGAARWVGCAGKLQDQPVPYGFNDATTVLGDLGVDQITPVSF